MGGVVVLGSFMMDLVIRAPRRPATGETLVGSGFDVFLGGKGCNQAIAAARAGAPTAMIGRLGADDFGARFLECLATEGIDATGVVVDVDEGTGVGAPLVEDSGANSIVIVPRANQRVTEEQVAAARPLLAAADVLLLQLELPVEVALAAARVAHEAGTFVILNPAPAVAELADFAGIVDLVVPNEVEAATLTGSPDPIVAGQRLRAELGCPIIVTVGEAGVWIVDGDEPERLPAHPVDAIDTVGAGDAFCGALGARLAAGDALREAAVYAVAAAAVCVTRPGAEPAMPTAADVAELLATV